MKDVIRLPYNALFDNEDQRQLYFDMYATLAEKIRNVLTPDLLKKPYREENESNPMFGHCYVASEAFYHLLPSNLQPCYGKDARNITHWWLVNETLGLRVDVTCDQYFSQNMEPPYENQKKASFLTNYPSLRAVRVIERVTDQLEIDHANV